PGQSTHLDVAEMRNIERRVEEPRNGGVEPADARGEAGCRRLRDAAVGPIEVRSDIACARVAIDRGRGYGPALLGGAEVAGVLCVAQVMRRYRRMVAAAGRL